MAVCEKTFEIYIRPNSPYASSIIGIEPYEPVSRDEAKKFNCKVNATRHPRETKGLEYNKTEIADHSVCGPDGCC
jgi:hypothetical protein